jgi:hypothetical protein
MQAMSWLATVCIAGVGWVIAFDTLGSLAARILGFRYAKLVVVQFAAYAIAGGIAALHAGAVDAALVGGLMGFVESTLGWAISWRIGPGRMAGLTAMRAVRIAVFLTLMAIAFALFGASVTLKL